MKEVKVKWLSENSRSSYEVSGGEIFIRRVGWSWKQDELNRYLTALLLDGIDGAI